MINLKYISILIFLILINISIHFENINQKKLISNLQKEKGKIEEEIYLKKVNWEAVTRPENLKRINQQKYNFNPITLDDVISFNE